MVCVYCMRLPISAHTIGARPISTRHWIGRCQLQRTVSSGIKGGAAYCGTSSQLDLNDRDAHVSKRIPMRERIDRPDLSFPSRVMSGRDSKVQSPIKR
jgi:hypothetical protein